MKATVKTSQNDADVAAFLDDIAHPQRKEDSLLLYQLMKDITKVDPKMWGGSIVGYGSYHYKYASGREGDWFLTGFSPRKQSMTVYIMGGFNPHQDLLAKLGKHKTSKACLYINKLSDIDLDVLRILITNSVMYISEKYE